MGKICFINGQPYMVSLPTGGKHKNDHNSQWDDLINFLGEDCNDIFHWKDMCTWCQEKVIQNAPVIRGYFSARLWRNYSAYFRYVSLGFRPVLTPLDADTLKPDPSLLEDIPDGRVFALASLYMNGKVIKNPTNPTDKGNVSDYMEGATLILGNRDSDPANWIYVIKHGDLLWVDRNILKSISWDDLKGQGFVSEEEPV